MSDQPKKPAAARILICEDEMALAKEMSGTLGQLGYELSGRASSGEEAVRAAEKIQPDLILMDINLQGNPNGIEACLLINARMDVPVVYLIESTDCMSSGKMGILREEIRGEFVPQKAW